MPLPTHQPNTPNRPVGAHRPVAAARCPRIALLSAWHPEPVDNGSKRRTRQMIDALTIDYDVVLISLLPPEEITEHQLPNVPNVWRQHILPLPAFHNRSLTALAAGLHPLPRSFVATWNHRTAAALIKIVNDEHVELAVGCDLRSLRYLLALD